MAIIDDIRIKQFRGGDDEIVKPAEDYVNPLQPGTMGHTLYEIWKKKYLPKGDD